MRESSAINLTKSELNRLYRFAYALCKNEDQAWDLLQSSITKLLEAESFSVSLLKTTIKNAYIDTYRRDQKYTHIEFSEILNELDVVSIEHPNFEDLLISKSEFNHCWSVLSADERELLFNHIIEGQTAQEIADIQNTSRGTVLSRIHRLKLRLKANLIRLREQDGQTYASPTHGETS